MSAAKFTDFRNRPTDGYFDTPDQALTGLFWEEAFSRSCDTIQKLPSVIDAISQPNAGIKSIRIHANGDSNFCALKICIAILTCVIFLIAIISALFGAWLVLPFAGLEIALLVVGARISFLHNKDADSLAISERFVHLTKHRKTHKTVHSFVRHWTIVRIKAGANRHEPAQLQIGSHGRFLEFGEFLTEKSKRRLYAHLTQCAQDNV